MLKLVSLAGLAVFVFASGGSALAQAKPAAEVAMKVVLDNDSVQVVDVRFKPGAVSKMQERPDRVVHYYTAAHLKETFADGTTKELTRKAGETVWAAKGTYEAKNIGKSEIHLLVVRVKSK